MGTSRKVPLKLYSTSTSNFLLPFCIRNAFQNLLFQQIIHVSGLGSNQTTTGRKPPHSSILVLSCVMCCWDCGTSSLCSMGCKILTRISTVSLSHPCRNWRAHCRGNIISTALFISSSMKLLPILTAIWEYDVPASARAVGWAVVVNNIEALTSIRR